jgi:hypothetical protein
MIIRPALLASTLPRMDRHASVEPDVKNDPGNHVYPHDCDPACGSAIGGREKQVE